MKVDRDRVFVARDTLRIRVKVDRDRDLVAGFTLSRTRIKGLTRSSGFQKLENNKSQNPKI